MNSQQDKLKSFFEKIELTNIRLSDLIDIKKIIKNIEEIEIDLNTLNYIISNSDDELSIKVKNLFDKNPNVFKILPLLVATKKDVLIKLNKNEIKIQDLLSDYLGIMSFINETGLNKLITSGRISNFIDYLVGVNVGLDTHSRKNRYGMKNEKEIEEMLNNEFNIDSNIQIDMQVKIEEIDKKKVFDFVVTNKSNGNKVIIESSFYNSVGSKLDTTWLAYEKINQNIKALNQKILSHYEFIWITGGSGLKSQQKDWFNNLEKIDFIFSKNDLIPIVKEKLNLI